MKGIEAAVAAENKARLEYQCAWIDMQKPGSAEFVAANVAAYEQAKAEWEQARDIAVDLITAAREAGTP
jgi:hypothetical protein